MTLIMKHINFLYIFPCKSHESVGGGVGEELHSFLTSAIDGNESSSNSRSGRFTSGKQTRQPLNRRLGRSQRQSGCFFGEEKNFLSIPSFEPRIVQTLAQSIYGLQHSGFRGMRNGSLKILPLDTVVIWFYSTPILTTCFFKISLNAFLPSSSGSPKFSFIGDFAIITIAVISLYPTSQPRAQPISCTSVFRCPKGERNKQSNKGRRKPSFITN